MRFLTWAIMATGAACGFFIILFAFTVITADYKSEKKAHWVYLFTFAWPVVAVFFFKISLSLDRYRAKLVKERKLSEIVNS